MYSAAAWTLEEVLPEVYEKDSALYVGQLMAREDADLAKLEEDREKIAEQALLTRRFEFFEDWQDDVVARATVTR